MSRSVASSVRRWSCQGAHSASTCTACSGDDLVVALVTVQAQRHGVSASFPEVHVWRLKNGKATEFREYQGDEHREDRFWSGASWRWLRARPGLGSRRGAA